MPEKIKISLPVIVEGRYDKATLLSIFDATVVTTEGFSLFNNREKRALIERLASDGIIVLTDSDAGGRQIREYLSSILPKDKIFHAYIPEIRGKEKRKARPSRAGMLGVEGVGREVLAAALAPFVGDGKRRGREITKVDLYEHSLSGTPDASERRKRLCALAGLPCDMSANALLDALNLLYGYDGYRELIEKM